MAIQNKDDAEQVAYTNDKIHDWIATDSLHQFTQYTWCGMKKIQSDMGVSADGQQSPTDQYFWRRCPLHAT